MSDLSVIIPAHNEADKLENMVDKLLAKFLDLSLEIIIVEDGCEDDTPQISEEISSNRKNVEHLHFDERLGKGKALTTGFNHAKGDVLGFIDADMIESVGDIPEMYQMILDGSDMVIGSRYVEGSESNRKPGREIPSRIYNHLTSGLLNTEIKDHQCGLKLLRRDVWDSLGNDIDEEGWFWDTALIHKAQEKGFTVQEKGIKTAETEGSSVNILSAGPQMLLKLLETTSFHSISRNRFLRFLTIGATGALINTVILFLLTEYTGLYYIYASAIGIETSIIAMFFLNNHYTFSSTKYGVELIEGLVRSNIIRSAGILANISLLYFFTEIAGIYYVLSNLIAIGIAAILNYYGEKKLNWKE